MDVRNGWAVGLLMVLAVVGWLALTFSHAAPSVKPCRGWGRRQR